MVDLPRATLFFPRGAPHVGILMALSQVQPDNTGNNHQQTNQFHDVIALIEQDYTKC